LSINTKSDNADTVAVTGEQQSAGLVVTVQLNNGAAETVDIGGGNVLLTQDLGKLEIKTKGGNDTINVSGITGMLGFDREKLDGKIELKGQDGNDTITGSPFDDILVGRGGDDTLIGGQGDDIYRFKKPKDPMESLGNDTIVEAGAGGGVDTLDYSKFDNAITIDLT